jgi:hypothetical protein
MRKDKVGKTKSCHGAFGSFLNLVGQPQAGVGRMFAEIHPRLPHAQEPNSTLCPLFHTGLRPLSLLIQKRGQKGVTH